MNLFASIGSDENLKVNYLVLYLFIHLRKPFAEVSLNYFAFYYKISSKLIAQQQRIYKLLTLS
jgi:hypothetical protein